MFRSVEMSKCEIYIQPEVAFETLDMLGRMNCIEFLDANEQVPVVERKFIYDLCRCMDMERKLKRMEAEMLKDDITIVPSREEPKPLAPGEMLSFENTLEDWETDLEEISTNHTILLKDYLQLSEMYYVLHTLDAILGGSELLKDVRFAKFSGSLPTAEMAEGSHLIVLTGVVRRARCYAFETMLWRISHSNIFFKLASEDKNLTDPYTGQSIRKVAFIIIVQGVELSNRVEKVCNGFKANLYNCPRTLGGREEMTLKMATRIDDMQTVLRKTRYHRCKALRVMSRSWHRWMNSTKLSKAIYHHMNLLSLDITTKCFIGVCWIPNPDLERVQLAISKRSQKSEAPIHSFITVISTEDTPPTYFATNKFTSGFQNLINAYGEAKYREVNPGLYTVITFPFLFAMMFGDMGHAFIMASFASWMIFNEKKFTIEKSKNEIWNIFFGGRYIILLMGLFSMYTGFVYNDMFAKQMVLMPSGWKNQWDKTDFKSEVKFRPLSAYGKNLLASHPPATYLLGRDPVWSLAKNKMVFENSLKMKLSIVVGVIHMVFGITLGINNHIHFKHTYAIFLEFLPRLVFLCNLFLYLVFMMFFKWFNFSMFSDEHTTRERCAPLLLIYFIDMVLMRTTKVTEEGCEAYMYSAQPLVQKVLLFSALICVPIMLCGPPCYEDHIHQRKRASLNIKMPKDGEKMQPDEGESEKDAEMRLKRNEALLAKYPLFGDLIITQSVETIEFVLSTVSHTASYLRLWALSLAHAQLSEMLWEMILGQIALQDHSSVGIFKIYFIFSVWATFTVSVMVLMEGLSAFLHTLRLHWVEFMSKFFIGGGYYFHPFSFSTLLEADDEEHTTNICTKKSK